MKKAIVISIALLVSLCIIFVFIEFRQGGTYENEYDRVISGIDYETLIQEKKLAINSEQDAIYYAHYLIQNDPKLWQSKHKNPEYEANFEDGIWTVRDYAVEPPLPSGYFMLGGALYAMFLPNGEVIQVGVEP